MSKNIKDIVREIWERGVDDFEEINRNWDPSEIKDAKDTTFGDYWNSEGKTIEQYFIDMEII